MRKVYSQIRPYGCDLKHVSHFPNMFLVRCDNYFNDNYKEACKPHGVIYWLKFLILMVCNERKKISISEILKLFSSYEEHTVRLCIGSLSTVNEYNCLNLKFSENVSSLEQLERSTFIAPTKRGRYLVDNFYCLGLDCLQVYFDDWLFPRPKMDRMTLPVQFKQIFKDNNEAYNYSYLLNGDEVRYQRTRKSLVKRKTKQCLLLISLLKHAREYEMTKYSDTWNSLKESFNGHDFFTEDFFENMKDRIINDAYQSMGKNESFKSEIENFNENLNEYCAMFDDFFDKVKGITK